MTSTTYTPVTVTVCRAKVQIVVPCGMIAIIPLPNKEFTCLLIPLLGQHHSGFPTWQVIMLVYLGAGHQNQHQQPDASQSEESKHMAPARGKGTTTTANQKSPTTQIPKYFVPNLRVPFVLLKRETKTPRPQHNKRHNIKYTRAYMSICPQQTPYRLYSLIFHTAYPSPPSQAFPSELNSRRAGTIAGNNNNSLAWLGSHHHRLATTNKEKRCFFFTKADLLVGRHNNRAALETIPPLHPRIRTCTTTKTTKWFPLLPDHRTCFRQLKHKNTHRHTHRAGHDLDHLP